MSTTIRFLSDEWVSAADRALSELAAVDGPLVVGYRVTGGPAGDSEHSITLGPDRVGVARDLGQAEVMLSMPWAVAVAVNRGESNAQREFLDGRITLEGNPAVLLGYQSELARIDDRLADLRAQTSYGRPGG